MILLTSFSENKLLPALLLGCLILSGCAARQYGFPWGGEAVRPLKVELLLPDVASPQAAGATIRWQAEAMDGAGERTFVFLVSDGKEERTAQEGPSSVWNWTPAAAGTYRVKVAARDAAGYAAESRWSSKFVIAPKLEVSSLSPEKASPQAADMTAVRWLAEARGGIGKRTFEFRISDGTEEKTGQVGASAAWKWAPEKPGTYRVKVSVRDAAGNTAESGWSSGYVVVPRLQATSLAPDKTPPQAAEMATVRWKAEASGGVGGHTFIFRISDGKTERTAQEGSGSAWDWAPRAPGTYRIRVVVRDAIGNTAEAGWDDEYVVAPKLEVASLLSDKTSPQAAGMAVIRWNAAARGGVGEHTYTFWTTDGRRDAIEPESSSPTWDWQPKAPGSYRVKVVARDAIGNTAESGWSPLFLVAPPMVVSLLPPDLPSPQAAGMAKVRWKVASSGGVGERTTEFRISDGAGEKPVQSGTEDVWAWSPSVPGTYRVKGVVRDAIGNTVDAGWSPEFVVAPQLTLRSFSPDKASPQAAGVSTVQWKADAAGGVGDIEYTFKVSSGTVESVEQKGPSPSWVWTPRDPGSYRVKVEVRDAVANIVDSGWSPEYRIAVTAGLDSLIAVMPVENLTGTSVSVDSVRKSLVRSMERKGFAILGENTLEAFLEKHRVRYTGGLNRDLGKALREETGTNAVLFVSLEMLDEAAPPRVAVSARLVSTHGSAEILWADGAGLSGNDHPGFLLMGMVNDPAILMERAQGRVLDSLAGYLTGGSARETRKGRRRFAPKSSHGVSLKLPAGSNTASIAVLPFRNDSTTRNAGEILGLHFLRELSKRKNLEVLDSGDVRQILLQSRVIMEGGLSLPQVEILSTALEVDLVVTGIVTEYQDAPGGTGNPKVEFTTRVFDTSTRQISWASNSFNQGDDGVFFFGAGKVNTAHGVASEMVRSVVDKMQAAIPAR